MKKLRNETKQTVQFNLEYAMLFRQDDKGHLRQLSRNALDGGILSSDGTTLELDN